MYALSTPLRVPPAKRSSVLATLSIDELVQDVAGVALPRPEVHIVVRFGPVARDGIDVYAMGGRRRVHRKALRGGHRVVMARLHLGTTMTVLGVPASAVAGQIVALEDLWGRAPTRRLYELLERAANATSGGAILNDAIAERALRDRDRSRVRLALDAANRLESSNVNAVADDLGVSERHLRRVFQEAIGVNPKSFAQVMRFRRALQAARTQSEPCWAGIAVDAGYYDQAHLIAEFRTIAGATPQSLLGELRQAQAIG